MAGSGDLRIIGHGSASEWLPACAETQVIDGFDQVVDFRPDDLVIRVGCRVQLNDLSEVLEKDGLCLPIVRDRGWLGYAGQTVGGLVGLGLPHYHQETVGSVRDWVIGMTIRLATGEVVTSGSGVVKSVAGFDLHRMMVGSRGELGEILEVGFRVSPIALMPTIDEKLGIGGPVWIHRVPRGFRSPEGVMDASGRWIWADRRLEIPPSGWAIGPGGQQFGASDPVAKRFRSHLKNALDPNGVWNEGWKR